VSLKKHLQALETYRASNNERGVANTCFKIGDIYLQRGSWQEAKEYLREAKAICGKLGNEEGDALTSIGLGDVYRNSKNHQTARIHYQQALDFFESRGDEKNIANLLERLGELHKNEGHLSRALEAFSMARDICLSHDDQLGVAHFSERMALVQRQQENFDLAIDSFQQALLYYERHRVAERIAFVLTGLGELAYNMGRYQKGMECLGRALQIYQKLGAKKPAELVAAEIALIEAALADEEMSVDER
jgi:tetratricopeptide (TPR) repeat protein